MARSREFSGAAAQTRLNGAISSGATSFTVVVATGFPTGAAAPFVVVIDRGMATEEKILCASSAGTTFTVTTRGYDGTAAAAHADQATVEHVLDTLFLTALDVHIGNTVANPHPEYLTEAEGDALFLTPAEGGAAYQPLNNLVTHQVGHTFAISGDIVVPSGDLDYIVPLFIPVGAGRTVTLTKAKHRINGGTSATVKLQKNGSDITGWTGISVTTTSTVTDAADATFADGDMLALVVTAVSGSPKNLSFTVYLEHD